eukprot:gene1250-578_t
MVELKEGPAFFVPSSSKAGAGRSGKLMGKVQTPAVSVITQRGLPAYLSRDLLDKIIGTNLLQLPLGDMLGNLDNITTANVYREAHDEKPIGAKEHFNIGEDRVSFLSFRNPRVVDSVFGGEASLTLHAVNGRQKIDVARIVAAQNILKCDILTAPAEETPNGQSGSQKTIRAVKNSGKFLGQLLEQRERGHFKGFVLGNVQGGSDKELRERAVKSVAETSCDGFSAGGLGYYESASDREEVLSILSEHLPVGKPRFLPLLNGAPVEILQAVFHGMDVIETDYPTEMARAGFAFLFELDFVVQKCDATSESDKIAKLKKYFTSAKAPWVPAVESGTKPPPAKKSKTGQAPKVADKVSGFWNVKDCHVDTDPISKDSFVLDYSRAYVNHMYKCGELLGTMLVAMHNLHKYNELLKKCREHLDNGTFLDFAIAFMETQTDVEQQ